MIHKLIAAGLIGSIGVAAPAAQAPAQAGNEMSRGEVQAKVREHFSRLDKNRDGVIAQDELDIGRIAMRGGAGGPGQRQVIIKRLGEDGELDEHGAHGDMMVEHPAAPARDPAKAFERLDTNKDGTISRDEFAKGREVRIERRIVRGGPEGADRGPGKRMQWRHRGRGMGGGRMIVMSDTDRDGRITLGEAEAMALQHFDQMDTNKDGRVTVEERRAGRPVMFRMRETEHAPKAS